MPRLNCLAYGMFSVTLACRMGRRDWNGLRRSMIPAGPGGDGKTQAVIRQLAEDMGCRLIETEYSGDRSPCCGYGGLTAYANRELAKEMTEKCLARSDAPYISYCMACRDRFARQGRESRHILELVYGTDAGAPPDISEKRYNRLSLKNELLRETWHEEAEEMKLDNELKFTEAALKMMDGRVLPPGEYGQLVITTIGMEALPLICYRTGDYTRILPEPCPCGSRILRLDRLDRWPQGTEITALDNVLLPMEGLLDFRAESSGNCLNLYVLCMGGAEEREIRRRVETIFPDWEIRLDLRAAQGDDRSLYRGKRCILMRKGCDTWQIK